MHQDFHTVAKYSRRNNGQSNILVSVKSTVRYSLNYK